MATYRIIKVRRSRLHGYVTAVQCRKDTGTSLKKSKTLSVKKVRTMMEGNHFYTFSSKTRQVGSVSRHKALSKGISIKTIRSAPGTPNGADLDKLSTF